MSPFLSWAVCIAAVIMIFLLMYNLLYKEDNMNDSIPILGCVYSSSYYDYYSIV